MFNRNTTLAITLFSLGALPLNAQEVSQSPVSFLSDPFNHPMVLVYVASALIVIVFLLIVVVALRAIQILNTLTKELEKSKPGLKPRVSWWDRFSQQMNASVPVEQEKDIELDHSFDGIKELDNHLPPWWTWLFYGTIAWSAVYVVVYHFSDTLPLQTEEYQIEVAVADEAAQRLKASSPIEEIDVNTLAFTNDQAINERGKSVFSANNCGSCHRADGGGNTIGPNLTDNYWLHGGDVKEVFSTVKNGVVEKGMPAWGNALSPTQVRDVTFYVLSLQGSNPPNAKAPQGEKKN